MNIFDFLFGRTPQKLYAKSSLEATAYLENVKKTLDPVYRVMLRGIINKISEARDRHVKLSKKEIEETFKIVKEIGRKIGESARGNVTFDGYSIKSEGLDMSVKAYLDILLHFVFSNIENPEVAPLSSKEINDYLEAASRAKIIDQLKKQIKSIKAERDNCQVQQLDLNKKCKEILSLVETGTLSDFEIQLKENKFKELKEEIAEIQEKIDNAMNRIFGFKNQLNKESRYNEMLKLLADRNTALWNSVCDDNTFNAVMENYAATIEEDKVIAEIANATYKAAMGTDKNSETVDAEFEASKKKGIIARQNAATMAADNANFGVKSDKQEVNNKY